MTSDAITNINQYPQLAVAFDQPVLVMRLVDQMDRPHQRYVVDVHFVARLLTSCTVIPEVIRTDVVLSVLSTYLLQYFLFLFGHQS